MSSDIGSNIENRAAAILWNNAEEKRNGPTFIFSVKIHLPVDERSEVTGEQAAGVSDNERASLARRDEKVDKPLPTSKVAQSSKTSRKPRSSGRMVLIGCVLHLRSSSHPWSLGIGVSRIEVAKLDAEPLSQIIADQDRVRFQKVFQLGISFGTMFNAMRGDLENSTKEGPAKSKASRKPRVRYNPTVNVLKLQITTKHRNSRLRFR